MYNPFYVLQQHKQIYLPFGGFGVPGSPVLDSSITNIDIEQNQNSFSTHNVKISVLHETNKEK